jgi:F-box-like
MHSYSYVLKMDFFSRIPEDQLEKFLLVIFDYLDDQDLLRCETVCHRWRKVLLSGKPWARFFQRKIASSPQWRQRWRNFVPDKNKLQTTHCRSLCRAIIQELKQIDRNWRSGNYKKSSGKIDSLHYAHVVIGCDYIAIEDYRGHKNKLKFHHRSNLKLKSFIVITRGWSATTNAEIAVLWDKKNIKILDSDGQKISEVPELDEDERASWKLALICLSGDQMAVLSRTKGREKLSLWDVRNPANAICLKSRFNLHQELEYSTTMKMDDQFIAVSTSHSDQSYRSSIYFFSKETLDLRWQMSVLGGISGLDFVYEKGMLLLYVGSSKWGGDFFQFAVEEEFEKSRKGDLNEMYDVKSGRCLRKLPTTCVFGSYSSVCFNSKFMVVADLDDDSNMKIYIYDMEDIKDPNSEANELFVLAVNGIKISSSLTMDDTEIFFAYDNVMHRFDFRSFEGFRNEANSVTLSSPWRSVWRSKGVDEETLELALHMDVYREVVKYFQQLTMDCQAAIKTYPIRDFNSESLTLGEDFIGCGPKMVIYDENMVIQQQGMNCKIVQINKISHVSAMGKIIQLINSTTGNVVHETKLNRNAINFHFNCNLLVVVCKIRENEHFLSVWKVDNSLTHLKDVAIGDYEGSLQVDEQFIAVETGKRAWMEKTYNFISMKTLEVERSVSCRAQYLQYDKGYLFVSKTENLVGILDVASGTFLRDTSIKPSKNNHMICRVNSNYVVMNHFDSKLHVYDLKCLKETDAVPSHLLLTTIDLECSVKEVLMDETRIVCLSNNKMFVVDLKPIDRLRCPESF